MNAQEYCERVERMDRLNKQLLSKIKIRDDNSPLISLKDAGINLLFEPSIYKDYQYLVREAIVKKIGRISSHLEKEDKILIIRSVHRSVDHQRLIWDNKVAFLKRIHPSINDDDIHEIVSYFIAPATESMHNTGGAVDALIFDRKNICIMDFGTNDGLNIDLNKQCYPDHPEISDLAKKNRYLLIRLFENEDFVVDIKEYWHFDYGNAVWAIGKKKKEAFYDVVEV